jgi:hypothetical protein
MESDGAEIENQALKSTHTLSSESYETNAKSEVILWIRI